MMEKQQTYFSSTNLVLNSKLEDFVCVQRFPATVKDVKSGQYIICNEAEASRDGIAIDDYLGLTAYDIGNKNQIKYSVVENAVGFDHKIFKGELPLGQYQQAIPTNSKAILIEQIIKKPVLRRKNKQVVAILSYGHDITPFADFLYLFSIYEAYYPADLAVQYFLDYLTLTDYFSILPTRQELTVLLHMRKLSNMHLIAIKLKWSVSKVEKGMFSLCEKLRFINLHDLLLKLRPNYEYSSINE